MGCLTLIIIIALNPKSWNPYVLIILSFTAGCVKIVITKQIKVIVKSQIKRSKSEMTYSSIIVCGDWNVAKSNEYYYY